MAKKKPVAETKPTPVPEEKNEVGQSSVKKSVDELKSLAEIARDVVEREKKRFPVHRELDMAWTGLDEELRKVEGWIKNILEIEESLKPKK